MKYIYFTVILLIAFCKAGYSQEDERESENEKIHDFSCEEQFSQMRSNPCEDKLSAAADINTILGAQKSASVASNLANIKFFGPYNISARTRAFLIDKSNSNKLFAGGTSGGLWKSVDHGTTWGAIDDQAINFNVTCITQNPFNSDIIYYGTGEFIGNHTGVFGSGIFKSTDGGNTFSNLPASNNSSFTYCMAVKHSLVDPNTIFVGTNSAGLFRSTDGGNTFQNVFNQYNNVTTVACFPNGHVWIGVSQIGIFESPTGDNGTFTPLLNGLPTTGFSRMEMAFCDNFPQTAYIMYGNTLGGVSSGIIGIWKTTDSGATWNATANPDASYNFLYPKLNLCMAVKPDDPSFVVVGAGSLVYSPDGGATWSLTDNVHFDQHSIAFDPNNYSVVYNGSDGGATRHAVSTMQTTYENLNTGYNIEQFFAGAYFPSGVSCIAGAQDNSVLIGRNNDSIFTEVQTAGINGCFTQVNQQNANISYISGNTGLIFRSDNSQVAIPSYYSVLHQLDSDGNNQVDDDVWDVNPFEINLNDGNQLYFITKERVWRTTDGAQYWQPLINTVADAPYALGISNEIFPVVYIGGENGLFMRMNDAYNAVPGNEIDLSSSLPAGITDDFISCLAVHPDSSGIVYAAFSTYSNQPRIWKITDANTSSPVFTSISGNLPPDLSVTWLEIDPMHPDSSFIAATDFGLYTTIDAGQNWSKELSIPNVSIPNIRLRKSDRKLFIFTHGRGAWVADLSSGNTGLCSLPAENGVIINPNPTHGKINISLSKSDIHMTEIAITDVSGRIIKKVNFPANNNLKSFSIDLYRQFKGVYVVNVVTNKCEVRKKLVKM